MLATRACRLLGLGDRATSSQQPRAVQIQGPLLEPKQRLARWKVVTLKLLLVLETFALKNRAQAALGVDAYRRIFQRAREEDRLQDTQPAFQRMINGEIVGKPLTPGTGVPTVDPQVCNHPTAEMKRRGNKVKWWTCHLCKSRWERHLPVIPTGVPTDREIMTNGPHAGKSFHHIWENEHQYNHWVRLTADTHPEGMDPALYRLAAYLARKEQVSAGLSPLPESDAESVESSLSAEVDRRMEAMDPGMDVLVEPIRFQDI